MRTHRTVRLDKSLVDALESRARDTGGTFTGTLERYAEEGLRRDAHPLIVFRDGPAGRRAALAGSRLDVWQVIETVRAEGSVEGAAEYLSLADPQVQACVSYYAAYQDEVDEWTERMRAAAAREEEAWRREQAVLA
jgi:uncharacterized protein (DUF433 family)